MTSAYVHSDFTTTPAASLTVDQRRRTQIVLCYRSLVEATVARFRIRPADRADAIQNTWLRFLEHAHTIRDPAAVGGWLVTTARRECLHIIRNAARENLVDPNSVELSSTESSPEISVIRAEEHLAVRVAIAELGDRAAELVDALFFNDPASYADVSRRLDIPIGSIGPTRVRAIRQLRRTMADHLANPLPQG
jgi:RNA polymerase sigma factor (sigma-70 family)